MIHTNVQRIVFLAGTALLLSACGTHAVPMSAPRVAGATAAKAVTSHRVAPLEGTLTANHVLTYAHAIARQLDAKASFIGLTGTRISLDGTPADGGAWVAQYCASEDGPAKGNNPYANKITRRISVSIDAQGVPTVTETTEAGMPLGVVFLDAPLPQLDSCDVLKIVRKNRPAAASVIEKMALTGHPRDYSVMLWKITGTSTTQGAERPMMINASTGAVVGN